MNPFDEFFPSDESCSEKCPLTRDDPDWLIECGCPPARRWRGKWEPIILEAMAKAETLDLFYELGESGRIMVEESVREYLKEREE